MSANDINWRMYSCYFSIVLALDEGRDDDAGRHDFGDCAADLARRKICCNEAL